METTSHDAFDSSLLDALRLRGHEPFSRDPEIDPVWSAFERGDHAQAAERAAILTDKLEAQVLRVKALANTAGPAAAERAAGEALLRHPLSVELHLLRGLARLELGRVEEAAESARRAAYLGKDMAIPNFFLGLVLRRLGDSGGARRAYRSVRHVCGRRPPTEPVPLAESEQAGRLAQAAKLQLEHLQ